MISGVKTETDWLCDTTEPQASLTQQATTVYSLESIWKLMYLVPCD